MKKQYFQIIQLILDNKNISERMIKENLNISLNELNNTLSNMHNDDLLVTKNIVYIDKNLLTQKAIELYQECKVDNAIIMAAGFGSRFVPLTYVVPKGLIKVFEKKMIERQIEQLQESGITDIIIVVGYLKEAFEYLIDKYGVELVFNPDFRTKNNLSTLYHVKHKLKNSFILSSDNWLRENPYHAYEYDSWYSAVKFNEKTDEWILELGLNDQILGIKNGGENGWAMYGPVYFSKSFSDKLIPLIEKAYADDNTSDWYWEDVYKRNLTYLTMYANKQPKNQVYEFESLDDLRQFDSSYYTSSDDKCIELISKIFNTAESSIHKFKPLKFGMTNKSFLFEIEENKYIFRIPGEGTDVLINREEEGNVYKKIKHLKLSDNLVYFDSNTGIKITKFEHGTHNADKNNLNDVTKCMKIAKQLHKANLKVDHEFNFREKIDYYEKISKEKYSIFYNDYEEVRLKMNELLKITETIEKNYTLTHIDLVHDNCLIRNNDIYLIDWEYAGMCDPLADIAMFGIYANYDEKMMNKLMYIYFEREPSQNEIIRIYSYIALSGFLWSLWTCYKEVFGVSFEDYGIKMYRYAKEYYKKVINIIEANMDEKGY